MSAVKILKEHSHDRGKPHYPQHAVSRLPSDNFRAKIAWVDVCDTHNESWPKVLPQVVPEIPSMPGASTSSFRFAWTYIWAFRGERSSLTYRRISELSADD